MSQTFWSTQGMRTSTIVASQCLHCIVFAVLLRKAPCHSTLLRCYFKSTKADLENSETFLWLVDKRHYCFYSRWGLQNMCKSWLLCARQHNLFPQKRLQCIYQAPAWLRFDLTHFLSWRTAHTHENDVEFCGASRNSGPWNFVCSFGCAPFHHDIFRHFFHNLATPGPSLFVFPGFATSESSSSRFKDYLLSF